MYAVGRLGNYISRGVYTVSAPFHPFGGAVDIIVVEQPDGTFKSSPWYVRFGKFQGVLKSKEKVVTINVNDNDADFHMYLDHKGEAYFLKDVDVDGDEAESVLYTLSSGDETDEPSDKVRSAMKSKSLNARDDKQSAVELMEVSNGKVVSKSQSQILGLVFGRRSMKGNSNVKEEGSDTNVVRVTSLERAEIAADLLEMKWSTNLSPERSTKDVTSMLPAGGVPNENGLTDGSCSGVTDTERSLAEGNAEKSRLLSTEQVVECSTPGQCRLQDEDEVKTEISGSTKEIPVEEGTIDGSCSGIENHDFSRHGGSVEKIPCFSSTEQAVQCSESDQSMLQNEFEVKTEISRSLDEFTVENHENNVSRKNVISEMTSSDFQILDEIEASISRLFVDENDVLLQANEFIVGKCENDVNVNHITSEMTRSDLQILDDIEASIRMLFVDQNDVLLQANELIMGKCENDVNVNDVTSEMTSSDLQILDDIEASIKTLFVDENNGPLPCSRFTVGNYVNDLHVKNISSETANPDSQIMDEMDGSTGMLFCDENNVVLRGNGFIAGKYENDANVNDITSEITSSDLQILDVIEASISTLFVDENNTLLPGSKFTVENYGNDLQEKNLISEIISPDSKIPDKMEGSTSMLFVDENITLLGGDGFTVGKYENDANVNDVTSSSDLKILDTIEASVCTLFVGENKSLLPGSRFSVGYENDLQVENIISEITSPDSKILDEIEGSISMLFIDENNALLPGSRFTVGSYENDVNVKNIIFETSSSDSQILDEIEASIGMLLVDGKNAVLAGSGNFEDEGDLGAVRSSLHCEAPDSSKLGLTGCHEQTPDESYATSGGHGEVAHAESLSSATGLLPEDTVFEEAKGMKLGLEETFPLSESITHVTAIPRVHSVEEVESRSTPDCSKLGHNTQDESTITEYLLPLVDSNDPQKIDCDCISVDAGSIPPSESSEEEQFHFSDLHESRLYEVQGVDSICLDHLNKEKTSTTGSNCEPCSTSDNFASDSLLANLEHVKENPRFISGPISISRNHRVTDDDDGQRQVKSLPDLWAPTYKLDVHENLPLSHSLGSTFQTMKWTFPKKDDLASVKLDVEKQQLLLHEKEGHQLGQGQPTNASQSGSQSPEEIKRVLENHDAELSLCKHLLREGMGVVAASQAFDTERLDIDNFTSLDPTVKSDRLVLRIGGRYFPWDAASPIILEMVSTGSTGIFDPESMILIDQVEKIPKVDPSKSIDSPGGSWKLWPFSFKRSRVRKDIQTTPLDTSSPMAEKPSADTVFNDGEEPKVVKKMKKALTPTSEQLVSLNLKEGRNIVTFTFNTAMLGKQQVDARIYLWKWNSRIVISDVDGTITKSDVLGQFMPLVGVDWSQTGVTHLFSAIKENGYELLFLSARAISQASTTRQFLINLKKDGKALPEGPIVISPDGLFPSLYREVIRRAPHEFKIACLEDIKALFPPDRNPYPFYAGFGNRDTDEVSYLKVGIPRGKIFIINPKGEVVVNRSIDTRSYTSLHALVNGVFPVMSTVTSSSEQEDFNSWNFWKIPPPIM